MNELLYQLGSARGAAKAGVGPKPNKLNKRLIILEFLASSTPVIFLIA